MGNLSPKMIAFGVAGALIYVSIEGYLKNKALNTGMLAIGAVVAAKQIPVIQNYL